MCGIAGIIEKKGIVNKDDIIKMCDCLNKRGPDDNGIYIDGHVGLGHTRLSIIDLETGSQPMFSEDGTIVIVFNGEIYNFQSLREELENLNHTFKTSSDTEVIIVGYAEYGIDILLQKLEGMFAFTIYDKKQDSIYIARDKFGEKPLYYSECENKIIFASELKALENKSLAFELSLEGLNLFLALSYIPAPFSIYKNVYKLEAGCYLSIKNNSTLCKTKYYSLIDRISNTNKYSNFNETKNEMRSLLFDSVKKRMISDVPLGAFLSGGIDSSIITIIMSKHSKEPINTFSIGFKEKEYDELDRAQIIADKINSNHTVKVIDYSDMIDFIEEIVMYFDEPYGDSSAIPTFFVAKLAKEKVKVVLTGDCADELFLGYEKYLGQYYVSKMTHLPSFVKIGIKKIVSLIPHTKFTNKVLRKIKKVTNNLDNLNFDIHYNLMCNAFNDKSRRDLLVDDKFIDIKKIINRIYSEYDSDSELENGSYTDLKVVLEGDMLVKVDRMCMKNSVEARIPFLDSRIVELAYKMPIKYKLKGKNKKYILKETFSDILPRETLNFSKKGFTVPIDYWLKNELKEEFCDTINNSRRECQKILNYSEINRLFDEHIDGKENHMNKLWNIYVFLKWYQIKIEKGILTGQKQ